MSAVDVQNDDDLRDLYRELILDHSRSPRHFGKLANATHMAEGINPLCGDKLRLYLQLDDDGTIAGLIKKAGAGAALLLLIARRKKRDRTADLVRQVARQVGLRPPRPLSAYGKMVARTQTAIVRNGVAAKIVDEVNEDPEIDQRWALFIRDGRNGPTDHACERVDSRWATAAWLRRHRVEHPNCTRIGYPRVLPAGARITLLS